MKAIGAQIWRSTIKASLRYCKAMDMDSPMIELIRYQRQALRRARFFFFLSPKK